MAAANVFVTLTDPDRLRDGDDPVAPFEVRYILVYRYGSESDARADNSGTLINTGSGYTWEVVESTTQVSDPNIDGPYRYGYYDSSQTDSTWYRYKFGDSSLVTFSQLSEPWEADNRPTWALRDVLWEVGQMLGRTVQKGTAESNADAGDIVCTSLFKSTLRDSRFYEGWYAMATSADGAAPEGEEAQIDSVDTSTGTATLERDLSAAITTGDTVLISALLSFDEMIRVINRTRERMQVKATVDIALDADHNRYPAPWGVKAETDILEAYAVNVYSDSAKETLSPVGFRLTFDGVQGWVETDLATWGASNVIRLVLVRNYRDLEGPLEDMGDTTEAPIEWLRPACAYAVADYLADSDPADQELQRLRTSLAADASEATGIYAPEIKRRVRTGYGRQSLPGPAEVN